MRSGIWRSKSVGSNWDDAVGSIAVTDSYSNTDSDTKPGSTGKRIADAAIERAALRFIGT